MTIIWAIVILGALGIIFGLILAVAAKVFEVEVDPRLPEIQAVSYTHLDVYKRQAHSRPI